jgi:Holliday junction resolvase-like predicted endonuclease
MVATSSDVGQAGESAVVAELKKLGYRITSWDTQGPGATDIEAASSMTTLLVQVKTAVSPNAPASLSGDERRAITARALRKGAEAWEARVFLANRLLLPVAKIAWQKLN